MRIPSSKRLGLHSANNSCEMQCRIQETLQLIRNEPGIVEGIHNSINSQHFPRHVASVALYTKTINVFLFIFNIYEFKF